MGVTFQGETITSSFRDKVFFAVTTTSFSRGQIGSRRAVSVGPAAQARLVEFAAFAQKRSRARSISAENSGVLEIDAISESA
ncbi:hypothetical protein DF134_33250 [Burkholderia stagnalis]|uniref:DUF1488 domain-containing protein n=1 Tax=Burkholderia stagnalis TaxID=1503054 RepID=A0ABX9YFJ8_9BURK|nr:hypothetical protein DF134_33250 [Burkholderia stagnalis]RQR02021.1 hypothetical protein DF025_33995 [Burkholderia stagnalis]RQR11575.1 hypothetical protein DF026_34030 [Burkholderia stagnalis]RQY80864.1 hypothetical protein DF017_33705 [Burkholderia stagnalis]